jgi:CHAD domain-containing protein
MEVEAKFSVPNGKTYRRLARCRELAGYRLEPTATVTADDWYLDTRDGRFLAGGYACRLRREGDAIIATLKGVSSALSTAGTAPVSGIHRRDEQEVRLDTWTTDLSAWPESPARTLALRLADGVGPEQLFELVQQRTRSDVFDGERHVAEFSLDLVRVELPGRPARYYEVEVELKDGGTEADLQAIAGELAETWELVPEPRSKFERALEAFRRRGLPASRNISPEERTSIEAYAAESPTENARRAAVVLGWADGLSIREIADYAGLTRAGVRYWLRAFQSRHLGILDGKPSHAPSAEAISPASLGPDRLEEGEKPEAPSSEARGGVQEDEHGLALIPTGKTGPLPAPVASPTPPVEAPPAPSIPPIRADEPMSEAGRKLMLLHFTRVMQNEEGTRAGEDPEALHDMRVATRRVRAVFLLFTPYFASGALAPFQKRLRRTGRVLGAVRDLDVLLGKARGYAASLPSEQSAGLEPLLADWQRQREAGRKELTAYLDSGKYRKFKEGFEKFLMTPQAGALPAQPCLPVPYLVRHVAARLLFARYETVRAYEGVLAEAPLTTYHQLRIDCKRFRYALEFFRDVLGPQAPGLIKQVVGMQDLLGDLQDACVSEGLIAGFLEQEIARHMTEKRQTSLDGVLSYLAAQWAIQRDLLGRFPSLWTDLIGPDFRRNLSLAVSVL